MSTFHFSPRFWELEVSRLLLGGLSCAPVLKSIFVDLWTNWWFRPLLSVYFVIFCDLGAEEHTSPC